MANNDLPKQYDHKAAQERWYPFWEEHGYFHAEPDKTRKPYTIVIPPPNVTGALHLGHALNNTLQDILIRFEKLRGREVCWVPGTDHASIATEVKIVEMLAEKGIRLIAPKGELRDADLPVIPADLRTLLDDKSLTGVIDLGGDPLDRPQEDRTGGRHAADVDPVDAGTAAGTTGGGEAASGSGDPDGAGGVTVGGVTVGGVVGGVIDDATGDVIPVVTGTTGDLLDDVGATVDDVVGVVGALPNGLPAVGEAAGELLGGVGDTLDNTVGNLGSTVDTVVDTVGGAVGGTVTVVDGAVAGTVGTVGDSVGDIVDVDADDPVGDLVDDLLGDDGLVDGLIGDGGVVGGLVGGLIGGGAGGSGGAVCIPLPLLPCP